MAGPRRPLPEGTTARRAVGLLPAAILALLSVQHYRAIEHRDAELRRGYALLQDGRGQAAANVADALIDAEPLDADALGLLAFAQADPQAGAVARRVSRRAAGANVFAFEHAYAARDYTQAAQAADRIMRSAADPRAALAYAHRLERSREGQAALFALLPDGAAWGPQWLASAGDHPAMLTARAQRLAEHKPALGCATTEAMVSKLLERNDRRRAEGVWARHCGAGPTLPAIVQGDEASPFGWRRLNHADTRVEHGPAGYRIAGDARVTRPVLEQPVDLPPGRAMLVLEGRNTERLRATVDCGRAARPARSAEIDVPACETQRLVIWLAPGSGDVTLNAVRLADR